LPFYPHNDINPSSSPDVTEIIKCDVFSFGASLLWKANRNFGMSRFTREINSETAQINFHAFLYLTSHSILKNKNKNNIFSHTQMEFLILSVCEFGWRRDIFLFIYLCGSAAQRGLWPPISWGF
jgi:hypothetical protein